MEYYFTKIIDFPFEEASRRVTGLLLEEGFGVISEINLHDKFKEKLGVDFRKYRILGACNPGIAYKALMSEEKIGTMLPCNVLVIEKGEKRTEVSAVNPVASMMAIQNMSLEPIAIEVTEKLKKVIERL